MRIVISIFLSCVTMYAGQLDSLKVYQMQDSIVVVANRYQVSPKNLTNNYLVIPKEQIEALAGHSAMELVDIEYPSAFILSKNSMGYGVGTAGAGLLNLRGQGGKPNTGVLVLLNGHPDFMSIFGHPLPDVYGMDDIRQVEILAGPASTVFGNSAFGGVINLVSGPDFDHTVKLKAEGGSYGTYNLSMNVARNFGKHGLFFTINRKKSDGHIDKTSFESLHFQGGWQYILNNTWSVSVQGRYVPYKFDDPSRGDIDNLNLGIYGDIKRGTGELIVRNTSSWLNGSTQVYANFGHHEFFDGFKSDDRTLGFSSYQNYLFSEQLSLAAGSDIILYNGRAENAFAKMPNGNPIVNEDDHSLTSFGLYLVGFYNPVKTISLKGGLRYQYNTLPLTNITPTLGLTFNVLPAVQMFANYQSGFRSPTLMELYLFPSANEDLKAQKINSYEFGGMYSWQKQNSVRLSLFSNHASNLIQAVPNMPPPPPETFRNSGKADQWGMEAQIKQHLTRELGVSLAYSYLDPDDLTLYNPKHQIKYMTFWNYHDFNLILHGKYVQDLYAANHSLAKLPDYNIVNIAASYRIMDYEIYAKLNNLLDRHYLVLTDYEAPGFNWRSGIKISL
ncbi:MAG: TonB-dependent receptor [Calditrichae bacterium]|nr:TonB-dependent receptor [Calditrichota bacterium]MCB9057570.1 TonB-dependent receptor [Calditrichia bacterium]